MSGPEWVFFGDEQDLRCDVVDHTSQCHAAVPEDRRHGQVAGKD